MNEPLADIIRENTDTIENFRSQISLSETFQNYANAFLITSPAVVAAGASFYQDMSSPPLLAAAFTTVAAGLLTPLFKRSIKSLMRKAPEDINQELKPISTAVNVEHPEVRVLPKFFKNFTAGYHQDLDCIFIKDDLFDDTKAKKLGAIFGHELGHVVYRSSSYSAPRKAQIYSAIFSLAAFHFSENGHSFEHSAFALALSAQILTVCGMMFLKPSSAIKLPYFMRKAHKEEFFCDEFGARATGDANAVILSLKDEINDVQSKSNKPMLDEDINSHPAVHRRIARLEALDI